MNAKTPIARVLLALGGLACVTATASAGPDFGVLISYGDPVYARPIVYERERPVATIWIDGEPYDLTECEGVRAGVLRALECAGYDAWCEGYTIVVDKCHCEPRIRWESCDYRLTVREHCDELRLWVRPKYREQEVEAPVIIRDRYRVQEPVILEPPSSRVGVHFEIHGGSRGGYREEQGGGRFDPGSRGAPAPVYRGREDDRTVRPGNREDDRSARPGNRDNDRGVRSGGQEDDRRGGTNRQPPSYETQRFDGGRDDSDVRFDLDGGFYRAGPSADW